MRTEQPDKAQPLFTEATLGFEPQEQFVNAGNSWFYACDTAYVTLLNKTTEFQMLDVCNGWIHARMTDESESCIPETACVPLF